jgi:hypothetical protein
MVKLNLIQNDIKTETIQLYTLNQFILYVELVYPLCLNLTSKLNEEIQYRCSQIQKHTDKHTFTLFFVELRRM